MLNKQILSSFISVGLLLGVAEGVTAEMPNQHLPDRFRPIEQPLSLKVAVTLGGVGLIAAELWWFLLSKNSPPQTTNNQDIRQNTL